MKKLKVTIIGNSIDLGFLGHTRCYRRLYWPNGLFFIGMLPLFTMTQSLLTLSSKTPGPLRPLVKGRIRSLSQRILRVAQSPQNIMDRKDGYRARISELSPFQVEWNNLCAVGNTLQQSLRDADRIPVEQDIVFIHLGVMELTQKYSPQKIRALFRQLLLINAGKSPNAHFVIFGLGDIVHAMSTPGNKRPALPFVKNPRVTHVQSLLGFDGKLKLNPRSDPATVAWAERLKQTYCRIYQHELQRAMRLGFIRSFTYVPNSEAPLYQDQDRSRYFAIDGVHLADEGSAVLANWVWQRIRDDIQAAISRAAGQVISSMEPGPWSLSNNCTRPLSV